jgi:hypothetical protein
METANFDLIYGSLTLPNLALTPPRPTVLGYLTARGTEKSAARHKTQSPSTEPASHVHSGTFDTDAYSTFDSETSDKMRSGTAGITQYDVRHSFVHAWGMRTRCFWSISTSNQRVHVCFAHAGGRAAHLRS